jgi:hypothetical protein
VKLAFYWSNDHQHLADVALRGFGGVAGKGESEYSSVDSSDFAALQEWLVLGDSISTAKKASEIFEVPPFPIFFFFFFFFFANIPVVPTSSANQANVASPSSHDENRESLQIPPKIEHCDSGICEFSRIS